MDENTEPQSLVKALRELQWWRHFPWATLSICVLLQSAFVWEHWYAEHHGGRALEQLIGQQAPAWSDFSWLLAGFVHKNADHLVNNLMGLAVAGALLEIACGWRLTSLTFLLTAPASALIGWFATDGSGIGASGAVNALVWASLLTAPRAVIRTMRAARREVPTNPWGKTTNTRFPLTMFLALIVAMCSLQLVDLAVRSLGTDALGARSRLVGDGSKAQWIWGSPVGHEAHLAGVALGIAIGGFLAWRGRRELGEAAVAFPTWLRKPIRVRIAQVSTSTAANAPSSSDYSTVVAEENEA